MFRAYGPAVRRHIRIVETAVRIRLGPPKRIFQSRNPDSSRRCLLIWQFQILFSIQTVFPLGRPVSGTWAVSVAQGQTIVGRGSL